METYTPIFTKLLDDNDRIMHSAAATQNIQTFVDDVAEILNADIMIADPLHYILALSKSVQKKFPVYPDWSDLVSAGLVPPVLQMWDFERTPSLRGMLHNQFINNDLIIHDSLTTKTGLHCNMSDISENGKLAYKIAVTAEHPLTESQSRLFLTFIEVIQLAANRFKTIGSANRQESMLRQLIHGEFEKPVITGPSVFDDDATYRMLAFDAEYLGVYHLTFLSGFNAHMNDSHYLSAMIDSLYVVLINTKYEYQKLLEFMEQFSKEHRFPVLITESFDSLNKIPYQYQELRDCSSLASKFEGCTGLRNTSEFSMFRIFLKTHAADPTGQFIHPDVKTLCAYDEKHNTQYAQTLFRYLLKDCDASQTAEALYIHRNTLDNRLRKMSELITADWRDVNYKHQMLYSLFTHFYYHDELIW